MCDYVYKYTSLQAIISWRSVLLQELVQNKHSMSVSQVSFLIQRPILYVTFCILSGTFSSGHVYPQSGACPGSATHVSADGVYWVETQGGCSDTVAIIARRYDLDMLYTLGRGG